MRAGNRKNTGKRKERNSFFQGIFGYWRAPIFRFGLKFAIFMVLFYALISLPFSERLLLSYLEANAWFSNLILHGMGQKTHVSGVMIQSPHFTMAIRRGCDAVEPTALFCAAVVAFPAGWRARILGVLAGIILLQVLNLVRIVTLYWVGIYLPAFFNSAHVEIWPTVFILVAILLFAKWMSWSSADREPAPNVA